MLKERYRICPPFDIIEGNWNFREERVFLVNRLKLIEIQINTESVYIISFWHFDFLNIVFNNSEKRFRIKVSRRVLLISFASGYIKINFVFFFFNETIYFLIYRCSLTLFIKKKYHTCLTIISLTDISIWIL